MRSETTLTIERLATFAMGTRFELVLVGDDAARLRMVGEAALREVEELDARWSVFRRDSLVSFINANAFERPVRVDSDTFAVLDAAERVRVESGGLFDVAVGAAMARWGFRGEEFTTEAQRAQRQEEDGEGGGEGNRCDGGAAGVGAPEGPGDVATDRAWPRERPSGTRGSDIPPSFPPRRGGGDSGTCTSVPPPLPGRDRPTAPDHGFRPPSAASTRGYSPSPLRGVYAGMTGGRTIQRAPPAAEGSVLTLCSLCLCGESSSVRLTRPGVRIDLGGIAKGYAIDAALRVLREHGVSSALIHGGTSCVGAIGGPAGEEGWRVAIGGDGPVVSLRDRCMAVSSPSGRTVDGSEGERGHIMDPRTAAPAACAQIAAVIGPSGALADAWTKPALIERGRPTGIPAEYKVLVEGQDCGAAAPPRV